MVETESERGDIALTILASYRNLWERRETDELISTLVEDIVNLRTNTDSTGALRKALTCLGLSLLFPATVPLESLESTIRQKIQPISSKLLSLNYSQVYL